MGLDRIGWDRVERNEVVIDYLGRCQSSESLGSHRGGGTHEVQVGVNGLH